MGTTSPPSLVAPPEASPEGGRRGTGALVPAFVLMSFLGASLLFLLEPMIAKMLLPLLGGTADVWNTAMVFFQAVLLAGYTCTHVLVRRLGVRRHTIVQLAILVVPIIVLPVAVPDGADPTGQSPILWTLLALTLMAGLPFFALSTIGPTVQRWFAATDHPRADDPYFLYAAGNVGSLLALLAYPLVVEPLFSVVRQAQGWAVLYGLFLVVTAWCAWIVRRSPGPASTGAPATTAAESRANTGVSAIGWRTGARWVYLAAIPSALMLGVTRHLSSDVAAMPLLWVVPLSLYLVTFIIAFGAKPQPVVRVAARALKLLVIPAALTFFGFVASLGLTFGLHLAVFFCAALVAHGRLSSERPEAERLTAFYLLLSLGGMLGGVATALVAPVIFPSVLEYPLALVLALSVLPTSAFAARRAGTVDNRVWLGIGVAAVVGLAVLSVVIRSSGTQQALTISILVAALVGMGAYLWARTPKGFAAAIGVLLAMALLVPANPTLTQRRTFFGVHRVYEDAAVPGRHVLLNGTTVHGIEDTTGPRAGEPTTYYHRTGPIGQVFSALGDRPEPLDVGLVGLGSGALAAYGRPGDDHTYYEIDPAVIDLASDPELFTFIHDSDASVRFREGDGRLALAADDAARYDLLVVDAFSGDAIPVHLITDEALALYQQRTTEHGVLAFHISNRYFDFAPVLGRLAAKHGMVAWIQNDEATQEQLDEGKLDSTWVLLGRSEADLAAVTGRASATGVGPAPGGPGAWRPLVEDPGAPLWTDDYSDLLHVFRW